MPYDVPVENTIGVLQAVRDPRATRKILENYQAAEILPDVILPDYPNLEKPLVEVFTIDFGFLRCLWLYAGGCQTRRPVSGRQS